MSTESRSNPPAPPPVYSVGDLAQAGGVPIDTVRFYLRQKLLLEPGRTEHGHRRFTEDDVGRLRLILRAKAHGFTLSEIRELLGLLAMGELSCADLRDAVQKASARHRQQIDSSTEALERLERLIAQVDCEGPACPCCQSPGEFLSDESSEPESPGACSDPNGCSCEGDQS